MKTHHFRLFVSCALLLGLALTSTGQVLPQSERTKLLNRIDSLENSRKSRPESTQGNVGSPLALVLPANPDDLADLPTMITAIANDDNAHTFLNQVGGSINYGYGHYADLKTNAQDVQIRYNFIKATKLDAAIKKRIAIAGD